MTRSLLTLISLLCSSLSLATQPNILLLVAEDLSLRVGAFGDTVARTPNIDRLAQQGVRYHNVFTTAGVCAPSRAALISGQHQIAFGAQHMRTSTYKMTDASGTKVSAGYLAQPPAGLRAFPELLRRAGYYTFTDTKLDYQFSGVRAGSGPFTLWDDEGANSHWRNRPQGQPFFGLINFMETHESGVMRANGPAVTPAHRKTQQWRQASGLVSERVTAPADVQLPSYYPDIAAVRQDLARHYDNISAMDSRVGLLLAQLKEDQLLDSTIVIWTTDHGDGLPRAKRELYDSGIRVPMIIRFPKPRGTPGSSDNRLISMVDFAPTLLALAGVAPVPYHHGGDFLKRAREYIFASRDRIDEVSDRQRAVRDERYKYIRSWHPNTPGGHLLAYRDNLDMVRAMRALFDKGLLNPAQARWFEGPGEEQLYDIVSDPEELHNLAQRSDMKAVKTRLSAALMARLAVIGDTAATAEELMRATLLDDGKIPITPAPSAATTAQGISLSSAVDASIGYRIDEGPWLLYSQPVATAKLEAKAVRYGWRESTAVKVRR